MIIVGTHLDVVKDEFPPSFSEYLQQKIREKFISISDPEKCGLPRVLESVEVSCRSRENLRLLAHLMYDTAFSLKSPGSKTKLLEQKIPATYLALEEVVGQVWPLPKLMIFCFLLVFCLRQMSVVKVEKFVCL